MIESSLSGSSLKSFTTDKYISHVNAGLIYIYHSVNTHIYIFSLIEEKMCSKAPSNVSHKVVTESVHKFILFLCPNNVEVTGENLSQMIVTLSRIMKLKRVPSPLSSFF